VSVSTDLLCIRPPQKELQQGYWRSAPKGSVQRQLHCLACATRLTLHSLAPSTRRDAKTMFEGQDCYATSVRGFSFGASCALPTGSLHGTRDSRPTAARSTRLHSTACGITSDLTGAHEARVRSARTHLCVRVEGPVRPQALNRTHRAKC
jgi:hypothetical protein